MNLVAGYASLQPRAFCGSPADYGIQFFGEQRIRSVLIAMCAEKGREERGLRPYGYPLRSPRAGEIDATSVWRIHQIHTPATPRTIDWIV
jgi:hypothetical protein